MIFVENTVVRIKNNTVMNSLKLKDSWILELRSGQSKSLKEATLVSNWTMGTNPPIFVLDDDDDDDVVVSSSRPFAPVRNSVSQQSGREPILSEEDLELRLGLIGTPRTGRTSVNHGPHHKHFRLSTSNTIDLCDEVGEDKESCSKSDVPSNQSKEPKITCTICMDAMEEETSTVCGHIFCKKCITNAIQAHRKCPTCRKRLTMNNIHRIYLFSSTD